jgi:hypothetical protein
MDHFSALKQKVADLRAEIAQIKELNKQYGNGKSHDMISHVAHAQRHERLQGIMQELSRLADFGRALCSASRTRESEPSNRIHLVKNSSARKRTA